MSSVPSPATITYEQMMALFLETREQMEKQAEKSREEAERRLQEAERRFQENERRFQENERRFQENEQRFQENDRLLKEARKDRKKSLKELDRRLARLGDRLGELLETMVEGGIVRLFRKLGYSFETCNRRIVFNNTALGISGEIDLFLENGEFALLVEVKTNLSIDDIKDHLKRLEKYRIHADARNDKRQFIAAVGGGVIPKNVRDFALKQGMYVVQQSGENVKIIPPEGEPKIW